MRHRPDSSDFLFKIQHLVEFMEPLHPDHCWDIPPSSSPNVWAPSRLSCSWRITMGSVSRWTPGQVKLLLHPRHGRKPTLVA